MTLRVKLSVWGLGIVASLGMMVLGAIDYLDTEAEIRSLEQATDNQVELADPNAGLDGVTPDELIVPGLGGLIISMRQLVKVLNDATAKVEQQRLEEQRQEQVRSDVTLQQNLVAHLGRVRRLINSPVVPHDYRHLMDLYIRQAESYTVAGPLTDQERRTVASLIRTLSGYADDLQDYIGQQKRGS